MLRKNGGLTKREKRYVRAFTDPASPGFDDPQKSVAIAYPDQSPSSQKIEAARIPEREPVKRAIEEILDKAGLSEEYLSIRLKNLTNARKDSEDDYTAQSRGLDMAFKIRGSYASQKIELGRMAEEDREAKRAKVLETVRKFSAVASTTNKTEEGEKDE